MRAAKFTAGPWQIRRLKESASLYTVSRRGQRGNREHFEHGSDGKPKLYGLEQARAVILKAGRSAS